MPHKRVWFKSLKLWLFYVDPEESLGTMESTKSVYDEILELKIINAQIIVNYAAFWKKTNILRIASRYAIISSSGNSLTISMLSGV